MRYTIFPHFYALSLFVGNSAIAPFSVCENADRKYALNQKETGMTVMVEEE